MKNNRSIVKIKIEPIPPGKYQKYSRKETKNILLQKYPNLIKECCQHIFSVDNNELLKNETISQYFIHQVTDYLSAIIIDEGLDIDTIEEFKFEYEENNSTMELWDRISEK